MAFILDEGKIFERHSNDKEAVSLPPLDVNKSLPSFGLRETPLGLPQLSEIDVVRHFTRLSNMNCNIDTALYPLGSCTMKYNPKINDEIASLEGFINAHPYQGEELSQGALEVIYRLQNILCELTGLPAISLQPAAGAHGEFTGIKMIRAHLEKQGNPRKKVLIPDTAHGTNPATATFCQYNAVRLPSGPDGYLEVEAVQKAMDEDTAAIMITNPNTLGLFEKNIVQICDIVHQKGGLVYCDGANFNAVMGWSRPGDIGIDVMHLNLHKTFSTPHGGGGPGAGPVVCTTELAPYLPIPRIEKRKDIFSLNFDVPTSIGQVRMAYGNFLVLVRALVYCLSLGGKGCKEVSSIAVLNANYILHHLRAFYYVPYGKTCMHECVLSDKLQSPYHVKTMDIAKRLMDFGFHPPTVYFPLVVPGAMMIEPTESEPKSEIDRFISAMKSIAKEAIETPELLHNAPHTSFVRKVDEVAAARKPVLKI